MIGGLDRRVTVQTAARTPDDQGGFAESWSDLATLWARVEELGADSRAAEPGRRRASHRVTLRHRDDLDGGMRLLLDGAVLRILHGPVADGRRRLLTLLCEKV